MADVQIALVLAGATLSQLPTEGEMVAAAQVLTLSGTSQQSTVTVPAAHKGAAESGLLFFRVHPYGTVSCFAAVGAGAQTASATAGRGCPAGQVTFIPARTINDVCAVIQTA